MTNEDLLQKVLNATIERMGKQAVAYEAEIANLSSQIVILSDKIEELEKVSKTSKTAKES